MRKRVRLVLGLLVIVLLMAAMVVPVAGIGAGSSSVPTAADASSHVSVVIYGGWANIPVKAFAGGVEQPTQYTGNNDSVMWNFWVPGGKTWTVKVDPQMPAGLNASRWVYKLLRVEYGNSGSKTRSKIDYPATSEMSIQSQTDYTYYYQLVDTAAQPSPSLVTNTPSTAPILQASTKYGMVSGIVDPYGLDGNPDSSVALYKGIPFAAPPVGDLRWKPAQEPDSWTGVKACDKWPAAPMQAKTSAPYPGEPALTMSEDCLYLNLWTPATSTNDKKPVLVWFYGGSNTSGAASSSGQDGTALANKGIIVVEPQYRVNVFGFLATPELAAEDPNGSAGNYALTDMQQALKWVKENIQNFGGDPNNITIGGPSAGASCTWADINSTLTKGLFNHAIMESNLGGFMKGPYYPTVFVPKEDKVKMGTKGLELASLPSDLTELRAMSAADIEAKSSTIGSADFSQYCYCLDGWAFTYKSVDLMAEGRFEGIDLLVGSTGDDGALYGGLYGPQLIPDTPAQFYSLMKNTFGETLYNKYNFEKIYPSTTVAEARVMYSKAYGAGYLAENIIDGLYTKAHNVGNHTVHVYFFRHAVPGASTDYPAPHCAEQAYALNTLRFRTATPGYTADDRALAENMNSYWANFVKTGNPNGQGLPDWKECSSRTGGQYLDVFNYTLNPRSDDPFTGTQYEGRLALAEEFFMQAKSLVPNVKLVMPPLTWADLTMPGNSR